MTNAFISLLIFIAIALSDKVCANGVHETGLINLIGVFDDGGRYEPKIGKCPISFKVNELGGFIDLIVKSNQNNKTIKDISGAAYISGERLVFTTSPIYGASGLFILDCKAGKINRIVAPKKIEKNYPSGSDYFELSKIEKGKVFFYYSANVDQIDFNSFRSKNNLRVINLPIK